VAKVKLVAVQLETCHANTDGSAWYGYFDGPVSLDDDDLGDALERELEEAVEKSDAPLGIEVGDWEEVPSALSKYAGLRRYYVGAAT
jgi:hypothetical protein